MEPFFLVWQPSRWEREGMPKFVALPYSLIVFVVTRGCFFLCECSVPIERLSPFLVWQPSRWDRGVFSFACIFIYSILLSLLLPVVYFCANVAFPSSEWALSVANFSWEREREEVFVALSILLLSLLLPIVSFRANVAFLSSDWTLFSLTTFSWEREGVFVAFPILLLSFFMSTHYKNKWSYLTPKEEAAVNSKLHENLFISTCSFHWQYDSSWEAYGKNSFFSCECSVPIERLNPF